MRVMKTREGVEIKKRSKHQRMSSLTGEIEMFTSAFQFGAKRVYGGKDSEETSRTTGTRISRIVSRYPRLMN